MLVIDAVADRERWLAERWNCVTGSGLAALMGLSPFTDRQKLLTKYITRNDTFKVNRKMQWGTNSEVWVGNMLADQLSSRTVNAVQFVPENKFRRVDGTYIGATGDGFLRQEVLPWKPHFDWTTACPSGHIKNWEAFEEELVSLLSKGQVELEIKTCGDDQLKYWNDPKAGPPSYYWTQCQAQMFVLGVDAMAIVAKIGAHDTRGHIVHYDKAFMDEAQVSAQEFMQQVKEAREL